MTDERLSAEDLIVQFVMPRLESIDRKLDGKADVLVVNALDSRVSELERHGSQGARALEEKVDSIHKRLGTTANAVEVGRQGDRIGALEGWKNRITGALGVVTLVAGSAFGYVISRLF